MKKLLLIALLIVGCQIFENNKCCALGCPPDMKLNCNTCSCECRNGADGIPDGACNCSGETRLNCCDGIDNDEDGLIDYDDPDCGEDGSGEMDGGDAVEDCAGVVGGTAVVDVCGVCGGNGIAEGPCDCVASCDEYFCRDVEVETPVWGTRCVGGPCNAEYYIDNWPCNSNEDCIHFGDGDECECLGVQIGVEFVLENQCSWETVCDTTNVICP